MAFSMRYSSAVSDWLGILPRKSLLAQAIQTLRGWTHPNAPVAIAVSRNTLNIHRQPLSTTAQCAEVDRMAWPRHNALQARYEPR